MLGDYIYAQDREGGNEEGEIDIVEYPIQVESIYGDTLLDDYGCERGEGDFAGIPLTSAILEKNFEKKTLYGIFDDYFDLEIREYSDGIYIVTYHSCEVNVPDEQMVLSYVHELQHFLRHCRIDKNIVL